MQATAILGEFLEAHQDQDAGTGNTRSCRRRVDYSLLDQQALESADVKARRPEVPVSTGETPICRRHRRWCRTGDRQVFRAGARAAFRDQTEGADDSSLARAR